MRILKKTHRLFFSPGLMEIPVHPGQCGQLAAEGRVDAQDHSLSQSVEQIIHHFLHGSCKGQRESSALV